MRPSARPVLADMLTVRTTVILMVACVIGAVAGALTYPACRSPPQRLLAAGARSTRFKRQREHGPNYVIRRRIYARSG